LRRTQATAHKPRAVFTSAKFPFWCHGATCGPANVRVIGSMAGCAVHMPCACDARAWCDCGHTPPPRLLTMGLVLSPLWLCVVNKTDALHKSSSRARGAQRQIESSQSCHRPGKRQFAHPCSLLASASQESTSSSVRPRCSPRLAAFLDFLHMVSPAAAAAPPERVRPVKNATRSPIRRQIRMFRDRLLTIK